MIKIKFCGITRKVDLKKAIFLEADYVGFIFYPPSPRYLTLAKAKRISAEIDFKKTLKVGVFVDSDFDFIKKMVLELKLEVVQLHGGEDPQLLKKLTILDLREIWKAISVKNKSSLKKIGRYSTDFFLIDFYHKILKGGSGNLIPLPLVADWLSTDKKIILAGGMDLESIKRILNAYLKKKIVKLPYVFDINSKIEVKPGIKNHADMDMIKDFLFLQKKIDLEVSKHYI